MKPTKLKTGLFYLLLFSCVFTFIAAPKIVHATGSELGTDGICAIAILIFAVLSWILELAEIPITALIVTALIPFGGLLDFSQTIKSSFGNSIFAFFLGVLLLSAAFQQTNLGRLIAIGLFRIFGKRPRAVVFGIMLAGAVLAMWITEVAAAAILFPIALSVTNQTKNRADHSVLGRTLMLAVAWGPAFGGVATPIATGANLIALDYLNQMAGITIGFLDWMKIGVPICITLLVAGWLLLCTQIKDNREIDVDLTLPPNGKSEKFLLIAFLAAVFLWLCGENWGLSAHHVALLAAMFLFLPGIRVLSWETVKTKISWDSIILVCAGLAIGEMLYQTGVAERVARLLFIPSLLQSGMFITSGYIVLSVALMKVLLSSNTVSGIIMVPIMISLANSLGLPVWGLVAPCVFSTALALLVITSSPVNVIPYAAGYFTPRDMLRYGTVMTFLSAVIIAGWLYGFEVFL